MLVIAHHDVNDPNAFWSAAKEVTSSLPPHLKLHQVYPSQDMKSGTCVWEADSAAEVQKFLDEKVGHASKNFTYEVNEDAAYGLPARSKQTAIA
ncbi:MAG: hypothetical protein ABR502_07185 [Chitinophagaceae bacterium]